LVSTGFTVIGVFGYAELNIGDADIAEYSSILVQLNSSAVQLVL
jgi:hypothetical protein